MPARQSRTARTRCFFSCIALRATALPLLTVTDVSGRLSSRVATRFSVRLASCCPEQAATTIYIIIRYSNCFIFVVMPFFHRGLRADGCLASCPTKVPNFFRFPIAFPGLFGGNLPTFIWVSQPSPYPSPTGREKSSSGSPLAPWERGGVRAKAPRT